ncbi:MAG TPA: protein kinase, partial [Anaerolineaceae bacterium]|nr:protein kinase [Anaerolineaceae bacterium]
MELVPDTLLRDRYRIIRLLGRGGMGAVYLAYDTSLENQVAVKLNHNISTHSAQQFLREAQLLAMLRHPNLPRVSDYFVEQDTQCLVMDYIAGEDLNQMLEKYGRLPLNQVLAWVEQLGSALDYMHRQNPPVIHRDIKPGNIKLTAEGEALLVDFGIAKASDASQATATGAVGYTPGYAPPEQYGSGHTGPFSDQYAFAATIYTLLTGQKPVDSVQRVLGQAVLTPPGVIDPTLPRGVCAALERALNLRPNDRFINVSDLVAALTVASNEPTQPGGFPSYPTMATQAFPTVQSSAAATVAAGRTVPPPGGAPVTVAGVPAASPRRRGWLLPLVIVGGLVLVAVAALLILPGLAALAATATSTLPPVVQNTPTSSETPAPEKTTTPSETPPPTQTFTPQASATPSLTPTPQASPTFTAQPIGAGGALAFVSNRDGTYQIWRMPVFLDFATGRPIAGEALQLTTGGEDKFYPAWSPDGQYLVYSMYAGINEQGDDLG